MQKINYLTKCPLQSTILPYGIYIQYRGCYYFIIDTMLWLYNIYFGIELLIELLLAFST